ncbi:MAG: hypothetical protein PHV79_03170 [Clostridia bacterium]|nr:hypothetical protein [Clostridia bacterium]
MLYLCIESCRINKHIRHLQPKNQDGDGIDGAFNDGYNILKDLIKLAKKAKNQDMMALAMDVQVKLMELNEENQKLKKKKRLDSDIVKHFDGFVTLKSEKGKELYYCGRCYGADGKLILMQPVYKYEDTKACSCPNCKGEYLLYNYSKE